MKLKNWIIKQSLFWYKHIGLLRSIIVIICVIPLLDIQDILRKYAELFKITFHIMKMLFIPVFIITFLASIVYTVIYIKNNDI